MRIQALMLIMDWSALFALSTISLTLFGIFFVLWMLTTLIPKRDSIPYESFFALFVMRFACVVCCWRFQLLDDTMFFLTYLILCYEIWFIEKSNTEFLVAMSVVFCSISQITMLRNRYVLLLVCCRILCTRYLSVNPLDVLFPFYHITGIHRQWPHAVHQFIAENMGHDKREILKAHIVPLPPNQQPIRVFFLLCNIVSAYQIMLQSQLFTLHLVIILLYHLQKHWKAKQFFGCRFDASLSKNTLDHDLLKYFTNQHYLCSDISQEVFEFLFLY